MAMSNLHKYMLMVDVAIALEEALIELSKDSEAARELFGKIEKDGFISELENAKYHLDAMGYKRRDGKPYAW